jgi:CPA2 family monovalent cation:H+ antiporter-2
VESAKTSQVTAVIVGYGPVGQAAFRILKEFDIKPVVIDLNLDTIKDLVDAGEFGVYGDAARTDILEAAGIRTAKYLLATIPAVLGRTVVTLAAKELNPELRVFVRARYIQEQAWLEEVGATKVVTEEAETAIGLAVLLLREVGADENRIQKEITRIQEEHHT